MRSLSPWGRRRLSWGYVPDRRACDNFLHVSCTDPEYQRTERRARALEDVLLPELEETTRQIDGHLEALDLEEAVRFRCMRRG